ncbi:MAG TPA: hypothetical protein VGF28_13145 [Thermoanaerobaculia bacterium]|jgi:hypothetical protein
MHRLLYPWLALVLLACNHHQAGERHAAAADLFTQTYEARNLEASVGGTDCLVLIIDAGTPLDDTLVESMQYGTGPYEELCVEQLAEERRFRAVVYRDAAKHLWTYGAIDLEEARSLPRCRRGRS